MVWWVEADWRHWLLCLLADITAADADASWFWWMLTSPPTTAMTSMASHLESAYSKKASLPNDKQWKEVSFWRTLYRPAAVNIVYYSLFYEKISFLSLMEDEVSISGLSVPLALQCGGIPWLNNRPITGKVDSSSLRCNSGARPVLNTYSVCPLWKYKKSSYP